MVSCEFEIIFIDDKKEYFVNEKKKAIINYSIYREPYLFSLKETII